MNVNFTESAAEQARVIIAGEDPGLELRVYVQGGGCSGFQYGFTLDKPTAVSYTHLTLPTIYSV